MDDRTSLQVMNENVFSRSSTARARPDRPALAIVLAAGALLMLAAAIARSDSGPTASRTEKFTATLAPGSALRIENVSGDIVARRGREFQATVSLTVAASTAERSKELLGSTIVTQTREGNEYALETVWPLSDRDARKLKKFSSDGRLFRRRGEMRCEDCRITAHYDVTVPTGVRAILHTVNGRVRVEDLDGELDLQSVNGSVFARGTRRAVAAHSVNGKVEVAAVSVPPGASYRLNTVNGGVTLTLPRDAKFDFSASAMSGTIATTFPLPARDDGSETPEPPARPARPPRAPRPSTPATPPADSDDDVQVDVRVLEKQIDEAMQQADIAVERANREVERQTRRIQIVNPMHSYSASIGHGGASIQMSTLNGRLLLLAEGTGEADAKPLVSRNRHFSITVPRVDVHVRVPRVPRVNPSPRHDGSDEDEVVQGDVSGDFLSTTGAAGYRVGNVSGRVKIFTRSGEIHVGSVGRDAEIRTLGGDIQLGPVGGNLSAHTSAGDIRCRSVAGTLDAETAGGDIRVERVEGGARVRTAGGDVSLPWVGGSLNVQTSGGEVRAAVFARDPRGGISVSNAGGDVTLTLPADFRGDFDLTVSGVPGSDDEKMIHSDFPEIAITRRAGSQYATGQTNGGGTRVAIHTSSGEIRLRKAPAQR
jgi:DUF4097 and DUF4098 domain-containing protein YvlB